MDLIAHAVSGDGVLSGGAITAQGSPNMSVNVAVGEMRMAGVRAAISSAANPIAVAASDPTNPRIDLMRVSSVGTPSIVTGTPASTPKPPALTAGFLFLGYISVAAAAVNIQQSNITQRQVVFGDGIMRGALATRPAATGVPGGTLFIASDGVDGETFYYSNATVWSQAGAGSAPTTITTPNLILNSDFSRRTVFGLAMPEVFADTSGYTAFVGTPTVGSNILTAAVINTWVVYPKVGYATFWRDGRTSATFKAVSTTSNYEVQWHLIDSTNYIRAGFDGAGSFFLGKVVAGTPTTVASVAQALTLNRWYWLEIETQGTTVIAKVYDTGGTASGVTKASSTLLQTLTGTVADAAIQLGGTGIAAGPSNAQWGGIATGNGGVYVETWLPESMQAATVNFSGTLGGQAIGFDEAVDSGPVGKQWALRVYIPAASRSISITRISPDGSVAPSTAYAASTYMKLSGYGGSGVLIDAYAALRQSDNTIVQSFDMTDTGAGMTTWTRRTTALAGISTARRGGVDLYFNPNLTATGTAYVQCSQLEQGSAATAWRNAPADDAPIVWKVTTPNDDLSRTFTAAAELDSRDLALNLFLPWDAVLHMEWRGGWYHSAGGKYCGLSFQVDGGYSDNENATGYGSMIDYPGNGVTNLRPVTATNTHRTTAGKHRVAPKIMVVEAGTVTLRTLTPNPLVIVATRGK